MSEEAKKTKITDLIVTNEDVLKVAKLNVDNINDRYVDEVKHPET